MSSKIVGMIWLKDIQDAYHKEIERREITSSLASNINMKMKLHRFIFWKDILSPKLFLPNLLLENQLNN